MFSKRIFYIFSLVWIEYFIQVKSREVIYCSMRKYRQDTEIDKYGRSILCERIRTAFVIKHNNPPLDRLENEINNLNQLIDRNDELIDEMEIYYHQFPSLRKEEQRDRIVQSRLEKVTENLVVRDWAKIDQEHRPGFLQAVYLALQDLNNHLIRRLEVYKQRTQFLRNQRETTQNHMQGIQASGTTSQMQHGQNQPVQNHAQNFLTYNYRSQGLPSQRHVGTSRNQMSSLPNNNGSPQHVQNLSTQVRNVQVLNTQRQNTHGTRSQGSLG